MLRQSVQARCPLGAGWSFLAAPHSRRRAWPRTRLGSGPAAFECDFPVWLCQGFQGVEESRVRVTEAAPSRLQRAPSSQGRLIVQTKPESHLCGNDELEAK